MSRKTFVRWSFLHPANLDLTAWTEPNADPAADHRFVGCVRKTGLYPKMVRGGRPLWELADGLTVEGHRHLVPYDMNDTCNTACKTALSGPWMCGCRGCMGKNHGKERAIHLGEHDPEVLVDAASAA